MTIRGNKRLILAALAVVGLALIVRVVTAFLPHGHGISDVSGAVPFLFFIFFLSIMWNRLTRLEAEHGPDYVEPTPRYTRTLALVLLAVAFVLGLVAVFLVRR